MTLRLLCGCLLGVLLTSGLTKAHDVIKRSSDLATETKGRYDPCFNSRHIEIDNYKRSVEMELDDPDSYIDDGRMPYYWYRFTSGIGGEIPTSCPDVGRCTTVHPIWMKGTIPPDDDQQHTVQMCVNDNYDPKCEYMCQDALIKNCTDYLVYKLRPAPTTFAAYCAGNGSKCQEGEDSPTGFTPCEKVENIPAVPKAPTVNLDVSDPMFFYGRCTLTDPDPTAEHDVRWIADGNIFHRQRLLKGEKAARVSEQQMSFRGRTIVGYHLLCEVSARKENFTVGSKFTRVEGRGFFLGIQFVDDLGNEVRYLTINEETVNATFLHLKTSAPVRCNNPGYITMNDRFRPPCQISVSVRPPDLEEYHDQLFGDCEGDIPISQKDLAAQLTFGVCQVNLTEADWYNYTAHRIPVFAVYDNIPDGKQIRYINLRVSAKYQRVWDLYEPPWVKVTIEDQVAGTPGNRTCSSFTDPHMRTFDGLEYKNMDVGEFVLYENFDLNFRVHVYFIKCQGGVASCNCGVAAQAGDDVILLDRCNKFGDIVFDNDNHIPEEDKGKGYMRMKVLPMGEMTQGFTIEHTKGTNSYKINFPHGAQLRVTLSGGSTEIMNIQMIPSQEDFAKYGDRQKVRGLCGTFSGETNDDFLMRNGSVYRLKDSDKRDNGYYPDDFNEHWRIPARDKRSMYNGKIHYTGNNYKYKTCVCLWSGGDEGVRCQFKSYCDVENAQETNDEITKLLAEKTEHRRRRRDAGHDYVRDHDDLDLQFNPGSAVNIRPDERWNTDGLSKRDARRFCNELIMNATFYERCNRLVGIEFQSDIDMCIADIGMARTTEYAKGALDRAEMKCKDYVEGDMSLWTDDAFQPPPPLRYKLFMELDEAASDASDIVGASRAVDENDEFAGRDVLKIKHGSSTTNKNQIPDPDIVGKICPEACNAHGRCVNSKCQCEYDWIGIACSFRREGPRVYSIPQNGLCDNQARPCEKTPVHGLNFIPSKNLRCIFTLADGLQSNVVSTIPEFESYQEIHCPTPEDYKARALVEYNLQVTNDQRASDMISSGLKLRVFDSRCYQCAASGCTRANLAQSCIHAVTEACVPRSTIPIFLRDSLCR